MSKNSVLEELKVRRYRPNWQSSRKRFAEGHSKGRPVFSASHVQHVSDLHLKFALRPHHTMYASMADIHSATAEIRRSEQKERKKKKNKNKRQDENIMVCPIP